MTAVPHATIKNLYVVEHPLIAHKLSVLRQQQTSKHIFKELLDEITLLLAYEATKRFQLKDIEVTTPLETMTGKALAIPKPVVVPILRAGLGMVDSFLSLMPRAKVGHIGLFRNEETLQPEEYYFKLPENTEHHYYFVCDPMLATGGSIIATLNKLKQSGIHNITVMCIVAVPEGAMALYEAYPDIPVYAAGLDRQLNDDGFILPGLGDAGDRLFGTK